MGKKFKIEFGDGTFERQSQRSKISSKKQLYTKKIDQMNKMVESLDRLDDFNSLKISATKYKKEKGNECGEPTKLDIII